MQDFRAEELGTQLSYKATEGVVETAGNAPLPLSAVFSTEDIKDGCGHIACEEVPSDRSGPNGTTSCARCLGGGSRGWPLKVHPSRRGSRLFWTHNVLYDKGKAWLNGASPSNFSLCYSKCDVTWFEYKENPLRDARQLSEKPGLADHFGCPVDRPLLWNQVALVVSTYAIQTLYHFIMDNVFLTYLTLANVAQSLGCKDQHISVFTVTPPNYPLDTLTQFHPIWPALFGGPLANTTSMHGCFRTVVYGYLYNQKMIHHLTSHLGWYRDPVLATWFSAFASEVRDRWLPTLAAAKEVPGSLILWKHARMPDYMWNFQWNDTTWHHSVGKRAHIPVVRGPDGWSPLHEQVRLISSARGIISIEGSSFALAPFLPPQSLLFIVNLPLKEKMRTCFRLPETWHETTALHLGHSAVNWRFCGTSEDFGRRATSVMGLFMQIKEEALHRHISLTCIVIRDASEGARCYKNFSMPLTDRFLSCGKVGKVGKPFTLNSSWQYVSSKGVFEHSNGRGVWKQ